MNGFNLNTALLVLILAFQIYKVTLHRKVVRLVDGLDKLIRENLHIQGLTNTAMLEIAKGSKAVVESAEKSAHEALTRVQETVKAGVEEVKKLVPDSRHD